MNVSASECSSGCESGWTLYLDQTSVSVNECHKVIEEEDEEEEDLSMVSDASSGPPHYNEDDECENGYCLDSNFSGSELGKKGKRKKKMKEHGRDHQQQQRHPCLDDTASSPVLSFSKKNLGHSNNQDSMAGVMDFSQGFSATHYKEKSAFKKHFGFLKSSFAEKPDSKQPGSF